MSFIQGTHGESYIIFQPYTCARHGDLLHIVRNDAWHIGRWKGGGNKLMYERNPYALNVLSRNPCPVYPTLSSFGTMKKMIVKHPSSGRRFAILDERPRVEIKSVDEIDQPSTRVTKKVKMFEFINGRHKRMN